ncbi:MAG: hypothetical protein GJT30_18300 [Geobacter sp.]|nr:hypothetical protein [Geobacter sp.]
MTELDEKYECLRKTYADGNLDKLSIEQLKDYHSMVMTHGNRNQLNQDTYNHLINEISNIKRHKETQEKLKELKKPHWTVNPTFWVSLIAMTAACIAAFFTVFPRSSQPANGGQKFLGTKQTVQSVAADLQQQLSSSQQVSNKEKQK